MRWFNDILFLPYFKIGNRLAFLWKLYVNSHKRPKLLCRQQKGLAYRYEIN